MKEKSKKPPLSYRIMAGVLAGILLAGSVFALLFYII